MVMEYADKGVLCFVVHPGGVMTKLARNMPEDTHSGGCCHQQSEIWGEEDETDSDFWENVGLCDKPEIAAGTMIFLTQERRGWLDGDM